LKVSYIFRERRDMKLFGFGKKKQEEAPVNHGPQLAPYLCPFPLSGNIIQDEAAQMIYVSASPADFLKFRSLADGMDGFSLRVAKERTLVWDKKMPGEAMVTIKAFTVLDDCPPERLWDVLHCPDYRVVWDDSRLDSYLVAQLSQNCDIGYYGAKAGTPVYNRDFLNQRCWYSVGGGEYVIFNTSVPHVKCPAQKGFVRAISKISGYLIRPWGKGGCSLTYISNADPKGWIPTAFVNRIVSKFSPAVLEKIRKAAQNFPEWQAQQGDRWKKTWMQDIEQWPLAQPDLTHKFYSDRLNLGEGAAPVEEVEETSTDDGGGSPTPEGFSPTEPA
jgi:hypothetical protein